MAGYLQIISARHTNPDAKEKSPVLALKTMRREAVDTFDAKLKGLKNTGCKMGEVEEHDLIPFEQSEAVSQVYRKCTGVDKAGHAVTLYLERFHVGGQAEERGIKTRHG